MRVMINGRFVAQRATGVQRVAREFVGALDGLVAEKRWPDVEFTLAVPQTDDDAHLALGLANIDVVVLPGGSGHMWEQRALARAAAGSRLICLGNTSPLLPLLKGTPTAVVIHDLAYRLFPDDYSRAYRMAHHVADAVILRRANPLVTVSHTEASTMRRIAGMDREILVAPNGSCQADVFPSAGTRMAGGPLLYVGAFSHRKNIDAVVAIAVGVARARGLGSVLVGPPNDVSAALEASLPDDVRHLIRFAGFVDDAELAELYRTATALLYPSRYEASGLPPSEAMSHGCPVLASDLPVLHERCGTAALFCDGDDVPALIAGALRLVDEVALRERLTVEGREQALSFTWRSQAALIVDALLQQGR